MHRRKAPRLFATLSTASTLCALATAMLFLPSQGAKAQITGVNTPGGSGQPLYLGSNGNINVMIDANGNIGIGAGTQTTNPAYSLNIEGSMDASNATIGSSAILGLDNGGGGYGVKGISVGTNGMGVFGTNYAGGNGVYGSSVSGNGVSGSSANGWGGNFGGVNGVYGQTSIGQGVEGVATGTGNGVYGTSTGGWGGFFIGANGVVGETVTGQGVEGYSAGGGNGVYGTSASGWAGNFQGSGGIYASSNGQNWSGYFYPTASQYGVDIDNPWHNALLCLNGTCVTSPNTVPTGTLCGAYGTGGIRTNVPCQGVYVSNGCPGGYTQQLLFAADSNVLYSCVHN